MWTWWWLKTPVLKKVPKTLRKFCLANHLSKNFLSICFDLLVGGQAFASFGDAFHKNRMFLLVLIFSFQTWYTGCSCVCIDKKLVFIALMQYYQMFWGVAKMCVSSTVQKQCTPCFFYWVFIYLSSCLIFWWLIW